MNIYWILVFFPVLNGSSNNLLFNKLNRQIYILPSFFNFGSYLAGLIEGEDSIYVPKYLQNKKRKFKSC